jgi:diacylglycerol kinase (ATP)
VKPGKQGIARLLDATRYSLRGLRSAWSNEAAFRQEVVVVVLLFASAGWLARSLLEWLLLTVPLLLLLIVELLNSAIESAVDRIGSEMHELSGRAKDMGSAAVFFAILLIALTWGGIAWSHLYG